MKNKNFNYRNNLITKEVDEFVKQSDSIVRELAARDKESKYGIKRRGSSQSSVTSPTAKDQRQALSSRPVTSNSVISQKYMVPTKQYGNMDCEYEYENPFMLSKEYVAQHLENIKPPSYMVRESGPVARQTLADRLQMHR